MDIIDAPVCPECGRPMKKRTRKRDGVVFWGCSAYPKCWGARDLDLVSGNKEADKEVVLSSYQQAFIDAIEDQNSGNIVLIAVAGSGKTFIIVYALKCKSVQDKKVIFLAFNKSIANTLSKKAPSYVECSTLHSLGLSAITGFLKSKPEIDDKKKMGIAKELFPDDYDNNLRISLVNLASKCQNTLTDPHDTEAIYQLIDRYGIDFSNEDDYNENRNEERAIAALPVLLEECKRRKTVIDFDDMIWLPIVHNIPIPKYDWVFVDEAQDLNRANLELVIRAVRKDGRVVVVGDPKQSIYGFRGADTNAIPRLKEALNAKEMPLSITYRCPVSHVKLARQLVPYLEPAPWAKEGEIAENIPEYKAIQEMQDGDLVMCRTNAPLVSLYYALIKQGKKATIQGRDIGQGLLQLVDKLKPCDLSDLLEKLEKWKVRELRKLSRLERNHAIQALEDKYECIIALCEEAENLSELRARINNIFTDTATGIVLSSVHRAKGLEADNTFILKPNLMPLSKAKKREDIEQELNILYVALTRSKNKMTFIDGSAIRVNSELLLEGEE